MCTFLSSYLEIIINNFKSKNNFLTEQQKSVTSFLNMENVFKDCLFSLPILNKIHK